MSTMTPERAAEDLEKMWDEGPPTCQLLRSGDRVCGQLASFIWHCDCPTADCAMKIPDLFACKECHDYVVIWQPTWLCSACKAEVKAEWRPL